MKSRQVFLLSLLRAVAFAVLFVAPGVGFAATGDGSTILAATTPEAAEEALRNETRALEQSHELPEGHGNQQVNTAIRNAPPPAPPAPAPAPAPAADAPTQPAAAAQNVRDPEAHARATQRLEDARAAETSRENRMLGGITMAATGIGGMQLAQGLSEMRADQQAVEEMNAFVSTIRCSYGGGGFVMFDQVGRTPPESREFSTMRMEYMIIARRTQAAKEALGLPPGIESETIIDTSSLYQHRGQGIDGRIDTAQDRLDANSGRNRAIAGGVVAGVGIVGGVIGNSIINGRLGEKMRERRDRDAMAGIFEKESRNVSAGDLRTLRETADRNNISQQDLLREAGNDQNAQDIIRRAFAS